VEGERRRVGIEETRRRRRGVNRQGAARNGGFGGEMEGYGENRQESGRVAAKGALGVGLALPRAAGAPDRILLHRGADSFIRFDHALT
jgi:hypothetical protein